MPGNPWITFVKQYASDVLPPKKEPKVPKVKEPKAPKVKKTGVKKTAEVGY